MKIRPSGVLLMNDSILLLKYLYSGVEVYALPGGNQEEEDGLSETLVREFFEELNLSISCNDLVFVTETLNNKNTRILHLIFKVTATSFDFKINPEHTTCQNALWVPIDQISNMNLYPNVGTEIYQHLTGKPTNHYLGLLEQKWY